MVKDWIMNGAASNWLRVDTLVFAEVRVLKLVAKQVSIDVTFDQLGGLSNVRFLHEVDERFGKNHLFKRTLVLVKAWCSYEARILGAQGGLLGTYALTVMLIHIFNEKKGYAYVTGDVSPLQILIHFLEYFSHFDFATQCVLAHGSMTLDALANINGFPNSPVATAVAPNGATTPTGSSVSSSVQSSTATQQQRKGIRLVDDGWIQAWIAHNAGPSSPVVPLVVNTTPQGDNAETGSATSTPTAANVSFQQQFPIRSMNVRDPLRPASNLCRGVSRSNSMRIANAFKEGFRSIRKSIELVQVYDGSFDALQFVDACFGHTLTVVRDIKPDNVDVARHVMDRPRELNSEVVYTQPAVPPAPVMFPWGPLLNGAAGGAPEGGQYHPARDGAPPSSMPMLNRPCMQLPRFPTVPLQNQPIVRHGPAVPPQPQRQFYTHVHNQGQAQQLAQAKAPRGRQKGKAVHPSVVPPVNAASSSSQSLVQSSSNSAVIQAPAGAPRHKKGRGTPDANDGGPAPQKPTELHSRSDIAEGSSGAGEDAHHALADCPPPMWMQIRARGSSIGLPPNLSDSSSPSSKARNGEVSKQM